MAWNPNLLGAVACGLRQSAVEGNFVPYNWVEEITPNGTGGYTMRGCGWAHVAWIVAVMQGGAAYACRVLPVDSQQRHVHNVLKSAGLTRADLRMMNPFGTWVCFDQELAVAYEQREQDPWAYIAKSQELAEFFIDMLHMVPVDENIQIQALPKTSARAVISAILSPLLPKGKKQQVSASC